MAAAALIISFNEVFHSADLHFIARGDSRARYQDMQFTWAMDAESSVSTP
jgi:hypothetical protein